jgi:ferrous iron transport protein B
MSPSCHEVVGAPVKAGPTAVKVLLVGRPNSGKSSLFNALTGGRAHVGNYPGITVDVLEGEGVLSNGQRAVIVDLPGLYAFNDDADPQSDEGVARAYIERARKQACDDQVVLLAQVVDSTNLAVGLSLTRQLRLLGMPFVLLATQRDVLDAEGRLFDVQRLVDIVGAPVAYVTGRGTSGAAEVFSAIEKGIHDPVAAFVDFDPRNVAAAVCRAPDNGAAAQPLRLHRMTDQLDRWLMHPLVGPLAFIASMGTLFTALFMVADPASMAVESLLGFLSSGVSRVFGEGNIASFINDGVLGGAGTVVQFLPQIVLLTVALELIEASGYLARCAYLVERLLRVAGLGGRSFVPLLMGHACAVPAISATRTIRDPRERLLTLLVLPLTTCSARIPAYALLISAFFPGLATWIKAFMFLSLYGLGLLGAGFASFMIGRVLSKRKRSLPFVLELPPYRAPQVSQVARVAWSSGLRFLRDVGTTIVAVSAVLWVFLNLPGLPAKPGINGRPEVRATRTEVMNQSIAAKVGRVLEPVTAPLGFDWRINVGLIGSFGARELMVSTMGVIFGIEGDEKEDVAKLGQSIRNARSTTGLPIYSAATGLALMAFFVFACQCMSTVSALRRETRTWRWPTFVLVYSYALAYAAAFVTFHVARAFGIA